MGKKNFLTSQEVKFLTFQNFTDVRFGPFSNLAGVRVESHFKKEGIYRFGPPPYFDGPVNFFRKKISLFPKEIRFPVEKEKKKRRRRRRKKK